jgi:hypothetical protein
MLTIPPRELGKLCTRTSTYLLIGIFNHGLSFPEENTLHKWIRYPSMGTLSDRQFHNQRSLQSREELSSPTKGTFMENHMEIQPLAKSLYFSLDHDLEQNPNLGQSQKKEVS